MAKAARVICVARLRAAVETEGPAACVVGLIVGVTARTLGDGVADGGATVFAAVLGLTVGFDADGVGVPDE